MIKIGLCGSMVVPSLKYGGIEVIETIARLGYDYIELSISHLSALPELEFQKVQKRIADSGIPCESCNNFFPPEMKLTGPDSDLKKIREHAEKALERAAELGAKIVVFGSGPAKTVPVGFPKGEAILQLIEICRMLDVLAAKNEITIAIEPLRKEECNIINTVFEAMQLSKAAEAEHVKILVDYYHLSNEKESPDIVLAAENYIRHIHFARVKGRSFPQKIDEDKGYLPFFSNLKKIGYTGRISLEAFSTDYETDAANSIKFLQSLIKN
jgi:D-psicose/D-tagatose/L-ribulose 3-epimerase